MTTVLVVDDDSSLRAATIRSLKNLGLDVTSVESGEDAVCMLDEQRFDLVVTDLQMVGLTGLDVAERAGALSPRVPCILVTGAVNPAVRSRAAALGVFRVLEKPFSFAALAGAVGDALSAHL